MEAHASFQHILFTKRAVPGAANSVYEKAIQQYLGSGSVAWPQTWPSPPWEPSIREPGTWYSIFISTPKCKKCKAGFFLSLFYFQLGKLLSVDAVSFPDSILCKLHISKWSKQICPWYLLMHGETGLGEMGLSQNRDAALPVCVGAAQTASLPALLPSLFQNRVWETEMTGHSDDGCPAAGASLKSETDLGWLQARLELSLTVVGVSPPSQSCAGSKPQPLQAPPREGREVVFNSISPVWQAG